MKLLLATALASASMARAQTPPPKFEVASIMPCKAGNDGGRGGGGGSGGDPGRLRLGCQPLASLIHMAYIRFADRGNGADGKPVLPRQPVEGSPAWVEAERYTIDAKPETPQSPATMRGPMLQALLEERFKLKIRRQIRDVPVYLLVAGKGGVKLTPAKPESCTPLERVDPEHPVGPGIAPPCGAFQPARDGGVETLGQTLPGLCKQFSVVLDRDVIDRTGMAGAFDIHLQLSDADLFPWDHSDRTPGDAATPPLPTDSLGAVIAAVRKLGLRLESAKVPGEFLIVTHVERPSEN